MGRFLRLREAVDQALRNVTLKVDDTGKMTGILRAIGVEAFGDEDRMVVILREDDGFAEASAAGYFLAAPPSDVGALCRRCLC